jgi:hypothetical protein
MAERKMRYKKLMKDAPRSRVFVAVCCAYVSCMFGAYLIGLLRKDYFGVSFMPALLLTFPWPYIFLWFAGRSWLVSTLTAYYELPLFAISAFMNVGMAEALRRVRAKLSEEFVGIAPR